MQILKDILKIQNTTLHFNSFLPVILPIILIATKSMLPADLSVVGKVFAAFGDPVIALSVGVLLALLSSKSGNERKINTWLQESAEKAGGILVIIGGGGASAVQIGRRGLG